MTYEDTHDNDFLFPKGTLVFVTKDFPELGLSAGHVGIVDYAWCSLHIEFENCFGHRDGYYAIRKKNVNLR